MDSEKTNSTVVLDKDKNELKEKDRSRKRWEENGFEEQGGYMAAKKAKLEHQFNESASAATILPLFSGISIHINGYVIPPEPTLREMFTSHGGTYHQYQSAKTTFVVASNLARPTKNNLWGSKAIKVEWITDSIAEGEKLDHRKYMLYDYNKEKNQITLSQMVNKPQETNSGENNCHDLPNGYINTNGIGHIKNMTNCVNNNKEAVADANNGHPQKSTNHNVIQTNGENGDSSISLVDESKILDNFSTNKCDERTKSTDLRVSGVVEMPEKTVAKRKFVTDEGFLEDFFANSRLHLLSTHKTSMQLLISDMRKNASSHNYHNLEVFKHEERRVVSSQQSLAESNNSEGSFLRRQRGSVVFVIHGKTTALTGQNRFTELNTDLVTLMHIDLDCFFVSVGLLSRPHLVNKPVVVSHSKGTSNNSKSDIACASYEARKFGVKNGMWVSDAKERCPSVEIIPYDFEEYKRISKLFFETVASVTLNIEPGSLDEMVVDVTSVLQQVPDSTPEELAAFFRKIIFDATKCPASIGIGINKLLAKLAVKKAKPNGIYFLKKAEAVEFIANLPITDLPDFGYSRNNVLNEVFSITTCKEVLTVPIAELKAKLGDTMAEKLRNLCVGIASSELKYDGARPKSISIDMNYGVRINDEKELYECIVPLCKVLGRKLEDAQATALHLTLKLLIRKKGAGEPLKFGGHGIVDSLTRSAGFLQHTRNWAEIYSLLTTLLRRAPVPQNDIRGIGATCTKLQFDFDKKACNGKQLTLLTMSRGMEMIQRSQEKASKVNQSTSSTPEDIIPPINGPAFVTETNNSHEIHQNDGLSKPTSSASKVETSTSAVSAVGTSSSPFYFQNDQGSQCSLSNGGHSVKTTPPKNHLAIMPKPATPSLPNNEWLIHQDPSTVDINVLKELPKQLALEIARDYGLQIDESQLESDNDCVNGIPPIEDDEGSVDYTQIQDPDTITNNDNQGFYPQNNAEMNPYHNIESLDPNFLSALPASVRNEVVIQFQQAKGLKGQYTNHNSNDDPQPCSSKQALERDMQLRNGNLGPLGVCESVYDVPNSSEPSASSFSSVPKAMKPHSNIIKRVLEEESCIGKGTHKPSPSKLQPPAIPPVENTVDWGSFWDDTCLNKPLCTATPVTCPSLCGENDVQEIRKKIREGLHEIQEPSEEEIVNLTLYFDTLLTEGWLTQAQVLIKMIQRELETTDLHPKWVIALKDLILHVQRVTKKRYGGYLRFE